MPGWPPQAQTGQRDSVAVPGSSLSHLRDNIFSPHNLKYTSTHHSMNYNIRMILLNDQGINSYTMDGCIQTYSLSCSVLPDPLRLAVTCVLPLPVCAKCTDQVDTVHCLVSRIRAVEWKSTNSQRNNNNNNNKLPFRPLPFMSPVGFRNGGG